MESFFLCLKFKILLIPAAIFAPGATLAFFAAATAYFSARSSHYMRLYCDALSFDKRMGAYFEAVKGNLHLGGLSDQIAASLSDFKSRAQSFETLAEVFAIYAVIFAIVTLAFRSADRKSLVNNAFFISAAFLFIGLTSPMLTFQASKTITFNLKDISKTLPDSEIINLGETVFKYESKGVAGTVSSLFSTGRISGIIPGILIVFFSVVFPVVKLAAGFLSHNGFLNESRARAVLALGKWSMADVFIVAVLLSFLALDAQDLTKASVGIGFYFFSAYWMISTAAGHFAAEAPRTEKGVK